MYKYEIHLHSSACSLCAVSSCEEMVQTAKEKGYAGVVFTNHFLHGNTSINRELPWEDFVKPYIDDYKRAKNLGSKLDIDVLFGLEEVYERGKEMLIYGIEPELILNTPSFKTMSLKEMYELIHENGGITAVAHPFRRRPYIPNPDEEPDMRYFDAIEVYNWCNTDEDNQKAKEFAEKHGYKAISGSDLHDAKQFGGSGIAFEERVYDNKGFVTAFKEGRYRLIIDGKIV